MAKEPQSLILDVQEDWLGIYFKEKKIGWLHLTTVPDTDGAIIKEESIVRLKILNSPQKLWTKTTCRTDTLFALRSFNFQMRSGIIVFSLSGEFTGKNLELTVQSAGKTTEKQIPYDQPPYLFVNLRPYLRVKGFQEGVPLKFPVFLPATLGQSEVLLEVEALEEITLSNKAWEAFRVKASYGGLEVYAWYDKAGKLLKEVSPMGFTMIRENKNRAMEGTDRGKEADILAETMIRPDKKLPQVSKLQSLTITLKGIDHGLYDLSRGRQHLNLSSLKVEKEDLEGLPRITLPVTDIALQKFLKATAFIQSDHERIQNLAQRIVGTETEAITAVRRLMDWVYKNLEKYPVASLPSALEVLDLKAGDCNEHAVLMTALCRAAGLPANMVAGLVYLNEGFYYHAWVEVWLGKWISLDPVMGQFPADVTHIRLVTGGLEQQVLMAPIVGKLSLKITEYQ